MEHGAGGAPVSLDAEERELVRALLLAEPELVLGDDAVMRALIRATGPLDRNVVDLRDKLVERMEERLAKLVHTNRSVIAAAYENVASTRSVHEAVLRLMAAQDLAGFAGALTEEAPGRFAIEIARLCIEADVDHVAEADRLGPGGRGVIVLPRGMVEQYCAVDAPDPAKAAARGVLLRPAPREATLIYDRADLGSEALMRLDLSTGVGLLALGAADPERFSPEQGTELLAFFARVVAGLAERHLGAPEMGPG
ncbi:MAG: DUF484 family protein [Pseudomonadota bacterium]